MKLKNHQTRDAVTALAALQAFSIKDLKTNVNLARNLRRLKAAWKDIEDDRIELVKAHFGETQFTSEDEAAKHPKYREYQQSAEDLLQEETEIEKVLMIKSSGLETTKDKPAVPANLVEAIAFMISDFDSEEEPAAEPVK